jgi:lantibiotic modifying enzyme
MASEAATKDLSRTIALDIGRRFIADATWHEDRCNWLGISLEGFGRSPLEERSVFGSLSPELYSGTSGVALFLASLYAVTGDNEALQTAKGAIRCSLHKIETVPPSVRLGFYAGWTGIAFTAAYLGKTLGDEEFLDAALLIVDRLWEELAHSMERENDLIAGRAGAIVGIVALRPFVEEPRLLELAGKLASELTEAARDYEGGLSWATPSLPKRPGLLGFSHGASGIGYALVGLYEVTGEAEYWRLAERAFEYERLFFNPREGNWPDFREQRRVPKRADPLSFVSYWCHGAPGIAVARLKAYEVSRVHLYREELATAIAATGNAVINGIESRDYDSSLCHGLPGLGLILDDCADFTDWEGVDGKELVESVALAVAEDYEQRSLSWSHGLGQGEMLGLMLGLAGLGYFCLRLVDPSIPSVLSILRAGRTSRVPRESKIGGR